MQFAIGEAVLAFWKDAGAYFIGTVVEQKDEQYYVVFFDGDQGWIPGSKIKKLEIKEGDKVIARWSDGKYYPGRVAKVTGGAFYIHFDDGDKGWTSLAGIASK
ncbi:MAG: hypothetical protein NZ455_07835 [Bacteroidia bacterium]|nr:hypothetical protein [Bacteroidia bacterium]MDW8301388.1 hypothetical protein [Bacteroidia bacterium]